MIRSYVICATPRSGSNLLCEALSALGFAGRPFEHLWIPEGTDPEPLSTDWPRILSAGRGSNGVFGLKLMYYQARRLEAELPVVLGMEGSTLASVLARSLASPCYVYLTRRDHVRQAVSLTRAEQSGQWRSMDAASGSPRFDSAAITASRRFLEGDERNWEGFFRRNRVVPYRLTYEMLTADLHGEIVRLLAFLGHEPAEDVRMPVTQHHRQADGLTEEWVRCYEAGEA